MKTVGNVLEKVCQGCSEDDVIYTGWQYDHPRYLDVSEVDAVKPRWRTSCTTLRVPALDRGVITAEDKHGQVQ